jgi:prophage regulatory protein
MNTTNKNKAQSNRAIRLHEMCQLLGASRTSVWRWAKSDPTFPQPFPLSRGVTAWSEAEVVDWVKSKMAMRG